LFKTRAEHPGIIIKEVIKKIWFGRWFLFAISSMSEVMQGQLNTAQPRSAPTISDITPKESENQRHLPCATLTKTNEHNHAHTGPAILNDATGAFRKPPQTPPDLRGGWFRHPTPPHSQVFKALPMMWDPNPSQINVKTNKQLIS